MVRGVLFSGTLLTGFALAPAVWGAPNACGDTYVAAQKLRNEGRVLAARGALIACVRACSGTFSDECSTWLTEVSARVPSIVVRAQDPDGNDVTDVSVAVDGQRVASSLEGKPFELEVGKHEVVLERAGSPAVEREVVAGDGEARRVIVVRFERPEPPASPQEARAVPPPTVRSSVSPWVFGIAGVALVAVGSGFAIAAATNAPEARCAAPCFKTAIGSNAPNPDLSHAEDAYHRANAFSWVSTIAIGAGLVGIGIGAYLAITAKSPVARSSGFRGLEGTF